MSEELSRRIDELREINLLLRHQLEQAEAKLPPITQLVNQLAKLGLIGETVLVEEAIHQRSYPPGTLWSDSCQVIQPAIAIPGGFGIVRWELEDYLEESRLPEFTRDELWIRFEPFDRCALAYRALILPSAERLLGRLLTIVASDLSQPISS
jgi:hypothetical protein